MRADSQQQQFLKYPKDCTAGTPWNVYEDNQQLQLTPNAYTFKPFHSCVCIGDYLLKCIALNHKMFEMLYTEPLYAVVYTNPSQLS